MVRSLPKHAPKAESVPTPAEAPWLTRERVLVLVLLAASLLAVVLCYLLASPFLPALVWALALAVLAHPLHAWIERRVGHADIAAGLAVMIVAVTIVGPAVLAGGQLVRQAAGGIEALRDTLESGQWRETLKRNAPVAAAVEWIESQMELGALVGRAATFLAEQTPALLTFSVWPIVELLVTFFALFFFFRDHGPALRALRSLVPLSHRETDEVFGRVHDTIRATLLGTVLVAMVQGTLGGLMFWILGLSAPVIWGMVMTVVAIVPTLGPFVVWLPAAVFLALSGHPGKAAILIGWGVTAIGLVDNLVYPILVGNRLRLHTLAVFVAIVGGIVVFGASGLVLGPVILAVSDALVMVWRRRLARDEPAEALPP